MLNSADHEILNAHKCKNIKKFSFFSGSDKPRMLFFMLINVKMPTVVGILTFMSRINFMLSGVEHGKSFITSGDDRPTRLELACDCNTLTYYQQSMNYLWLLSHLK